MTVNSKMRRTTSQKTQKQHDPQMYIFVAAATGSLDPRQTPLIPFPSLLCVLFVSFEENNLVWMAFIS